MRTRKAIKNLLINDVIRKYQDNIEKQIAGIGILQLDLLTEIRDLLEEVNKRLSAAAITKKYGNKKNKA